MFKALFGAMGQLSGSKRGDRILTVNGLIKRSVIAYKIVGDEKFAALGELVMQARDSLSDKTINDEKAETYFLMINTFGKQLADLEVLYGLEARITAACKVAHASPSLSRLRFAEVNPLSDLGVVAAAIVANDTGRNFWSDAEVLSEQSRFGFSRAPAINEAFEMYGENVVRAVAKELGVTIVSDRLV